MMDEVDLVRNRESFTSSRCPYPPRCDARAAMNDLVAPLLRFRAVPCRAEENARFPRTMPQFGNTPMYVAPS